jgi:hypothetical protein
MTGSNEDTQAGSAGGLVAGTEASSAVTRLPHRQHVETMAGFGIPAADIARVLELDPDVSATSIPRSWRTAT